MKIAVFDIGTNSIHMLIVEINRNLMFEVLGHEKDITRLGDGSFESKMLAEPTMERALEVIDRFAKIARKSEVKKIVAVATSAVREAKNGGEFISRILKKSGVKVEVITGEEEARLIFLAAKSSVDIVKMKALVIDIGGGSVELILGDQQKIHFMDSFKLGVARLTDLFIAQDPPARRELEHLETYLEDHLARPAKSLRKIGFDVVIGTAGTMINMGSMIHQRNESEPLQFVNHYELRRTDVVRLNKELQKLPLEKRLKFPGLDPQRADIAVAGGVLVETLMNTLKCDRILLSDKGIREGLVLDFIEKNKKRIKGEEEGSSLQEKNVYSLARRCSFDQPHAEHVMCLALKLFDETRRIHRLGTKERELLKFASLLHDIGHSISYKKHHKHSYYLILNSEMDGFTRQEIETIAKTVKYHRKKLTKKKFAKLSASQTAAAKTVSILSAILRIADGLDRTHFAVVESLNCRISAKKVSLEIYTGKDAEIELWQALDRADLFEKIFKRKLDIKLITNKKKR